MPNLVLKFQKINLENKAKEKKMEEEGLIFKDQVRERRD